MKHSVKFCAMALMFFTSSSLFGQRLYVEFNTGYNFGINGSTDFINNEEEVVDYNGGFDELKKEPLCLSLGKGVNFGGVIGYNFNQFVGVELGVNYLVGLESQGRKRIEEHTMGVTYITTTKFKGSSLQFVPSLVFSGGFERINPYAGIGIVFGVNSYTKEEHKIVDDFYGSTTQDETNKYKGGLAIGLNVRSGVLYRLNNGMYLFVEGTLNSVSYSPKKSEVTTYKQNGIDVLYNWPTGWREKEYVKSYDSTDQGFDPNSPSQAPRFFIPFSSLGINIGIRVNLGNK